MSTITVSLILQKTAWMFNCPGTSSFNTLDLACFTVTLHSLSVGSRRRSILSYRCNNSWRQDMVSSSSSLPKHTRHPYNTRFLITVSPHVYWTCSGSLREKFSFWKSVRSYDLSLQGRFFTFESIFYMNLCKIWTITTVKGLKNTNQSCNNIVQL